MEPIAIEHSDFGPADRHYHVPPKPEIPFQAPPLKKGVKGWHILAGAAGVLILVVAIREWVKTRDSKKDRKENDY